MAKVIPIPVPLTTAAPPAAATTSAAPPFGLTESYQAESLVEAHGNDLRYDHDRKHWFVYCGHLWRPDPNGQVVRWAIQCARDLQARGEQVEHEATREKIVSFAKFLQSEAGIRRVLKIAMNLPPIAIAGGGWDPNPWVLGTPNGVVDLRTGRRRKGKPEDLITLSVGVEHDPTAKCPRWRKFLREIFPGDPALVRYMQRCVGYTLTGLTTEHIWWLLHGQGSNGKSVFLGVLAYLLGAYAKTIPFSCLTLPERAIPDDLAGLPGKRLVFASEAIEGARLNEARIKTLTGGDPISARPLYGRWFEFDPGLKLWLTCNHAPTVRDSSYAFWRRVRVIPFMQTFDGATKDKRLLEKLKAEGPGILKWALQGCRAWQRDGLTSPDAVLEASRRYADASDLVGRFLADRCEEVQGARLGATEGFAAFQQWTSEHGIGGDDRLTETMFGTRMAARFERQHIRTGNVYCGVQLRPRPDPAGGQA